MTKKFDSAVIKSIFFPITASLAAVYKLPLE